MRCRAALQSGVNRPAISHERIYPHVWADKKNGGKLYVHPRHSGKKYNERKGKNSGWEPIPNRVDRSRPGVAVGTATKKALPQNHG